MMKHTAALFALLSLAIPCLSRVAAGTLPDESCDVLVVGGGAAGIAAAGEAGRAGARVILLEQGFQVGGNMTTGSVDYPGLFFAYGEQVVAGFGWETVSNAMTLAGTPFPPVHKWRELRHSRIQHRINVPLWVAICEEKLRAAGVTIRYYSSPAALAREAGAWRVRVHAGGDVRTVTAKEIIDCTGSGTVAALAGAELMDAETRSPGTFRYVIRNLPPRNKWNVPALQKAYKDALADGSLKDGDTREPIFGFKHFAGLLTNYIETRGAGTDARGEWSMAGRAAMLRLFRFLKRQPGFEKIELAAAAAETGVRETTRVKGELVVSGEDYVAGRVWPDSLCYVFYPVDLHTKDGGVQPKYLAEGVKPTIPYRALLVKGVDHMLVAGRCLSADRMAMSAIRVQASCMSTGQAAGEAAALAARKGCSPRDVPVEEIKAGLRARGCIVP
ncbi:MAG: FAD-dependent oxidoreductase [Kiritimatiellia bacterium]